jgi:DNA-binding transcriptional MerR regulator
MKLGHGRRVAKGARTGGRNMVRKRDRYTRAVEKRSRPTTPAPKPGWLIGQLADMCGVSIRTLRYYVQLDLLEPSEFRGNITRYQRRELLRLVGVLRLQAETRLTLIDIKRKLHDMDESQLENWLRTGAMPPLAADALGIAIATPTAVQAHNVPASVELTQDTSGQLQGSGDKAEAWQRIHLLPGLELMVSADASPIALRVAQRIWADYVGR